MKVIDPLVMGGFFLPFLFRQISNSVSRLKIRLNLTEPGSSTGEARMAMSAINLLCDWHNPRIFDIRTWYGFETLRVGKMILKMPVI